MNNAFENSEIYHIYNRGVDKRNVFLDRNDRERFLESLTIFNTTEPVGGVFLHKRSTIRRKKTDTPLVEVICYCLNPNHFHLVLRQLHEWGISELMRRLGGYTKYFNQKYKRNGVLFQGRCKSKHVSSNEYLLYLSAYVNLNDRVHYVGHRMSNSSWDEYKQNKSIGICNTGVILEQFRNHKEYEEFALDTLPTLIEKKKLSKELESLLLE